MAGGSGKPLVIKAKNKEELMKQLEGLVGDKGKKALMGHIEHLVCAKGKVVQCQLPKYTDKQPKALSRTREEHVKAADKPEMSIGNNRSNQDPVPATISGPEKRYLNLDQKRPEKNKMPKTFSYSLFVTTKNCNNMTFEEFMSAAHEFGINAVDASGDDLRGYLSHLNVMCKMAATGKYDQQVHLDYDNAIRLHAQEIGWPAFKADNTNVANLYYGVDHGISISNENDEDFREADLELSCSDGHQSDVETECSTSNPMAHQSVEVNKPQWQAVTTVSTDQAILQHIKEDKSIPQGTQERDNMDLPQSLEMTLVTEVMETKSKIKNDPQWQSVAAVSTDPAILQYKKEDNETATEDNDPLPKSLEITLVTEAKNTMMPGNKRSGPTLGPRKADSTTQVIADVETDHSAETTAFSAASIPPKRILKRHMCSHCAKRFITAAELEIHVSTHNQQKYHICAYCSKIYTSEEVLRDHLHKHTVEPRVAKPSIPKPRVKNLCSNCGKKFMSFSDLTIHMRHHTGEPDPCIKCSMKFISSELLYQHMITHTEKERQREMNICSYCGKLFHSSSALTIHTRIHTGEKPYLCSHCGKKFSSTNGLKSHVKCHTGEKPHTCSECGKAFNNHGNLKRHMVIHSGKRPYKCQYCAWGFKHPYHLKTHIQACHSGKECKRRHYAIPNQVGKPHTCFECGKQYNYLANLKVHMITHTGGNLLTCPECGKKCSSDFRFRCHMMTHTGEKPFECKDCGKGFLTSTILDSHTRTHTGEKPYVCSDCGKAFSLQSNLQRHRKIHTGGARAFLCSYCGKAFTQKAALQVHTMIHTGEKPFVCSECGKGFSIGAYLRRHMKVHRVGAILEQPIDISS